MCIRSLSLLCVCVRVRVCVCVCVCAHACMSECVHMLFYVVINLFLAIIVVYLNTLFYF